MSWTAEQVAKPPSVHSAKEKTASRYLYQHEIASTFRKPVPPPLLTASTRSFSLGSHSKAIKYGSGKHANVELVPQPSDDASDPLNWPRWRRDLNLVSLLMTAGLVGAMKTAFVSTSGSMAMHFATSYSAIAALSALPLFLSALTGLASCLAAKIWGKRPVYLVSALVLLIGCAWNATTRDSYGACMGARVLQGLGWGAFDTLVIASIQDTYFEHERSLPLSLYTLFVLATTWGSPLLGGVASHHDGSFTTQFAIISSLFALALPLLVLGAPETAFDRPAPGSSPMRTPGLDFNMPRRRYPWRLGHWFHGRLVLAYLKQMKPVSYHGHVSMSTFLQAPRAFVAPTTGLLALLSLIPYSTLWGLALSLALLVSPAPLNLSPPRIGVLMAGPWLLASAVVGAFCFYRGFHSHFTRPISYTLVAAGSFLLLIGLLSFGLGLYNFMLSQPLRGPMMLFQPFSSQAASQLSPALLSFQLGVLAAAVCVIDTATRPVLARSASFTSPRIAVAHRSMADMNAGLVVMRSLAASAFVAAMPSLVSSPSGLKDLAIGLAVTQAVISLAVVLLWHFFEKTIWRADGRIMGLVDLRMLKYTGSFFDYN
ncbi:hypothetical protein CDD81_3339 [Ophiocordyceps australis]|uniref:Major facilitator superfamily (MFS) profile domain-containing protein n=1 Tax=Ophiocordyceps australis TaxID=1399860 RepID=A0A2C5XW97_9HYPO|nr:hypothetical protein CDD81_3339 [Ophiocordyceps australis]